jgi:drug/metabolite transporter (DMT)-like permease
VYANPTVVPAHRCARSRQKTAFFTPQVFIAMIDPSRRCLEPPLACFCLFIVSAKAHFYESRFIAGFSRRFYFFAHLAHNQARAGRRDGRAVLAAAVAMLVLFIAKVPFPPREHRRNIALATLGIGFGWPTMTTIALQFTDPSHAAVVNGLLPFSTALVGSLMTRHWPRPAFWVCALAGAAVVCGYAYWRGSGGFHPADAIMLVGVALGGLGYAAGAQVSKHLPGWQVISWVLVFGLPVTVPVAIYFAPTVSAVSMTAWSAFFYLAIMSQYVGFFFWYRGLALGGIQKVSQVQLLQIFLTLIASYFLVGERLTAETWLAAIATVVIIATSRKL